MGFLWWSSLEHLFAGDVAFRILETVKSIKYRAIQDPLDDHLLEETQIYVCDINPNMLNVGKKRAIERGNIMEELISSSKSILCTIKIFPLFF